MDGGHGRRTGMKARVRACRRRRQVPVLQIDAAENAHAREIESLAHLDDPHATAVTALRTRVLARFTELEDERPRSKHS